MPYYVWCLEPVVQVGIDGKRRVQ